ncbi:hypothetical protein GY661_25675, partial [Escherichia coli]|uniref:glycine betaine ABC transporter substrate-binding protein n=1 Tax=Escherichia coli TaxID=562 RepID=UPI001814DE01
RALASGTADVIPAFSSDGRIAADKLAILTDPKGAIPGYDAILLLAPDGRILIGKDAGKRLAGLPELAAAARGRPET